MAHVECRFPMLYLFYLDIPIIDVVSMMCIENDDHVAHVECRFPMLYLFYLDIPIIDVVSMMCVAM